MAKTNTESKRDEDTGLFTNGEDYVLDDLDQAILAALPDVGSKIGKYLDDAMFAAKLRLAVDPVVGVNVYSTRLKMLAASGYVSATKGTSRGRGWQRTPKGKLAAAHD